MDFLDLNNVCPKDDFPFPLTKILVDATIGHEAFSFMDGSTDYNQIRMVPKDKNSLHFAQLKVYIVTKFWLLG